MGVISFESQAVCRSSLGNMLGYYFRKVASKTGTYDFFETTQDMERSGIAVRVQRLVM